MWERKSQCCSRRLILDVAEHLIKSGVVHLDKTLGMRVVFLAAPQQLGFDSIGFSRRIVGGGLFQETPAVSLPPFGKSPKFGWGQGANHRFNFLRTHTGNVSARKPFCE